MYLKISLHCWGKYHYVTDVTTINFWAEISPGPPILHTSILLSIFALLPLSFLSLLDELIKPSHYHLFSSNPTQDKVPPYIKADPSTLPLLIPAAILSFKLETCKPYLTLFPYIINSQASSVDFI